MKESECNASEAHQHSEHLQDQLHDTVTWVERLPPGGSDGAEGVLDTIQGDALQFLQIFSVPKKEAQWNPCIYYFLFVFSRIPQVSVNDRRTD